MIDAKSEFLKIFKATAPYHHRYKVFDDFVVCAAISINNAFAKDEELEQKYLKIIRQYQPEDAENMSKLLACTVIGLETPCDFLGEIYMLLEISNSHMGQFFTPFSVSRMMAEVMVSDADLERSVTTLHEPACGSAGMILAYCYALKERGFNYQKRLFVQAVDLSETAAMMAYIQLSLCSVPAEVIIGNTLSMDFSKHFYTPIYVADGWHQKRALQQVFERIPNLYKEAA